MVARSRRGRIPVVGWWSRGGWRWAPDRESGVEGESGGGRVTGVQTWALPISDDCPLDRRGTWWLDRGAGESRWWAGGRGAAAAGHPIGRAAWRGRVEVDG